MRKEILVIPGNGNGQEVRQWKKAVSMQIAQANPLTSILSVAFMLDIAFGLKEEAARVTAAIVEVLNKDIAPTSSDLCERKL